MGSSIPIVYQSVSFSLIIVAEAGYRCHGEETLIHIKNDDNDWLGLAASAAAGLGLGVIAGVVLGEFLGRVVAIVHGTTIADNTLIQMNGAKTGLLTTQGFRDEIELRRGFKEDIWDVRLEPPPAIVPRRRRLGVPVASTLVLEDLRPAWPADAIDARGATAAELVDVTEHDLEPAIGFENMRTVARISDEKRRNLAQTALLDGDSPETVKARYAASPREQDPLDALQTEKRRIERTIQSLTARLRDLDTRIQAYSREKGD